MKKKSTAKKSNITKKSSTAIVALNATGDYDSVLFGVVQLLQEARRASARTVNAIMTATYWEIGRRIVECEQGGHERADDGTTLIDRLSVDLTERFGRGFGRRNVFLMKSFYLAGRRSPEGHPRKAAEDRGRHP